ncbi:MSCRAMM family protein [Aminipila terrae]|uniref:MSCRAMM family protein n=1 Tax=Aminipila terrae TaxID=2697030 RepID=UPI002ED3EDD3
MILTKKSQKTGILLKGAVFQLYELSDDSNPVETLKYTKVTDKKGTIQFGRLNSGKYKLVEVTAPVGYEIDKDSASRIIELDTSKNDTRIVTLNITNKPLLRAIQLLKTDDLGKALPGAEFTLFKKAIANENVVAKSESAVNGSVTFNNVAMGEYYIVETKAPTGYSASTAGAIIKAVVDKDGKVSYFSGENFANAVTDVPTIKNAAYKGNVIISKTDKTGSPLKGAEFTLYDENQKVVAKAVSEGDKGIAKFENIRFGNYIIKETSAPSGYIASDKVINITEKDFVKNNVEFAYTVENEKRPDGGSSGGSHNKPNNPEEKPQVNIPDEDVPLNKPTENPQKPDPVIIENQETPRGEGTIDEDKVPLGKLPATGGIGEEIFFGFGAGLVALGAGLRRKANKER